MHGNRENVKIVLLGDSGVGKSSIVMRFVANSFNPDTDATIGAAYMSKIVQSNTRSIKFNVWDTAGQERFHTLAKMYYRDANAAIIVYDISCAESFIGLQRWYDELHQNGDPNTVKIIIGNKEDLVSEEAVPPEKAAEYAQSIGAIFRKTSAKASIGIEAVFKEIAGKLFPEPTRNRGLSLASKEHDQRAIEKGKRRRCC